MTIVKGGLEKRLVVDWLGTLDNEIDVERLSWSSQGDWWS
jgi:hypothetical protein